MRFGVVPGLYFKSYSRYTESRIPFETLALCGLIESMPDTVCEVVDFNIKGEPVRLGGGGARFPGLTLDSTFYARAADELVDTEATGFFFPISIHTNGNLFHSVRIAQSLRQRLPDAIMVFTGLGPSSRHIDLLESYPHIDVVLRGEAEATAEELVGILTALDERGELTREAVRQALEPVTGLTYRKSPTEVVANPDRALIQDLDTLPLPSLRLYGPVISRATEQTRDIKYLSVEEHIHLEAGRGCPFTCTFCSNKHLWRRRYRLKSPERLLEEIRIYSEEYGGRKFLLHQQLFTANRHKTAAFCEALIESGMEIEWSCFTRTDCVNPELLTLMKRSGCNTIMFGIESGSQRIQDLVRKKTQLDKVRSQIQMVIAHGIKPQLSYIVGFPEETAEDIQATIDMYCRYKFEDDVESQIGLLVPVGGTDVLEDNIEDLDFDGVQTTTWYTRFFDDESYDEMARNPLVFPQNHYVKTSFVDRETLKFIKYFDIVASHLTKSCQYVVLRKLTALPFETYEAYGRWRAAKDPGELDAQHWDGELRWDSDIASLVVDFAQFLTEEIAPRDEDGGAILRSLVTYELHFAMVNARLREISWDDLCTATPPNGDDNFVDDPYDGAEIETEVPVEAVIGPLQEFDADAAAAAPLMPTHYVIRASGPSAVAVEASSDGAVKTSVRPVFRQVEF